MAELIVRDPHASVTILSGPVRSGKTTRLGEWAGRHGDVGGVLSPDGADGRVFVDLATGETMAMEPALPGEDTLAIGRFRFRAAAFDWANRRIIHGARTGVGTLVIDEIGPLELGGGGLLAGLRAALDGRSGRLVLVVREALVADVVRAFGLDQAAVTFEIGW